MSKNSIWLVNQIYLIFNQFIFSGQQCYQALTYAIMIHEDFNRPRIVRCFEYISFWLTKKKHSLGIMQFQTQTYIDDRESIRQAMVKIVKDASKYFSEGEEGSYEYHSDYFAEVVARDYNPGDKKYAGEVRVIYEYIAGKFYSNITPSFRLKL